MTSTIEIEVRARGYAFLPEYCDNETSEVAAARLGKLLSYEQRDAIHELVPRSENLMPPNTYSGIYGLQQFPLHTDFAHWRFPPRYLMLRCIIGFVDVPTLLVDGLELLRGNNRILLSRALIKPRRPIKNSVPLLRLFKPIADDFGLLRWDEVFIHPASKSGSAGVALMRQTLALTSPKRVHLANRGDTLVVDNWRMLHGRAPVPANCTGRKLERAYLEYLN